MNVLLVGESSSAVQVGRMERLLAILDDGCRAVGYGAYIPPDVHPRAVVAVGPFAGDISMEMARLLGPNLRTTVVVLIGFPEDTPDFPAAAIHRYADWYEFLDTHFPVKSGQKGSIRNIRSAGPLAWTKDRSHLARDDGPSPPPRRKKAMAGSGIRKAQSTMFGDE